MKFNSVKNFSHFGKEEEDKTFKRLRVDNVTEYEVVVDVVINRGTLVIKIEKVFD